MEAIRVPDALADRLGAPASAALVELLDASNRACAEYVMTQCAERFERRLVEETSKLRVDMAQLGATLRQEMTGLRSDLREDMAVLRSDLRQEIAGVCSDLRQEITGSRSDLREEIAGVRSDLRQEIARLGSDLRSEMATNRVELLKWAFLFWIGQFVSVVSFVALMLRYMPPR